MTLAMGAVIIVAHNQFGPPQCEVMDACCRADCVSSPLPFMAVTSGSGPCYATPKPDATGLRVSL